MAQKAKVRQLWLDGVERTCAHKEVETVWAEGGTPIAERCKACGLIVAQVGRCAGCGRDRRCQVLIASRGRRGNFCTEDCYRQTVAAERLAKIEHAAKKGA